MKDTVWANALLSDGKILFWYTGDRCHSANDFYKDFFYSDINQIEYEKNHALELVCLEIDNTDNCKAFNELAPAFYRCYEISPDSCGQKPY